MKVDRFVPPLTHDAAKWQESPQRTCGFEMALWKAFMGKGRLAGLRVNMREVGKEFREVHGFRVYWRSGFYGRGNKAK